MDILEYANVVVGELGELRELGKLGKSGSTLPTCRIDADCRLTTIPDFNSAHCVRGRCLPLRGPGMPCHFPEECASHGFFGPLACSAKCSGQIECRIGFRAISPSTFCCRETPPFGDCNPNRPGLLSGCGHSQECRMAEGAPRCLDRRERSWIVAVFCSVSGNVLINVGINLQKLSYRRTYVPVAGAFANTLGLGVAVYAIGKAVSFAAYVFGNQSLMAGLSATGLVSNSLFAPLINDEIFSWKDGVAIVLVSVGSTILVASTSKSHTVYSFCELVKLYWRPQALIWFGLVLASILAIFLYVKFVEANSDWDYHGDPFNRILRVNRLFFDEDSFTCQHLMVLAYVGLSSLIASFTTLSIKSLGEIISRGIGGDTASLLHRSTLLFASSVVICTLLQIYWLNRALVRYDALLVVPIFHISWTLLSITTAGIYFQDFDHFSSHQFRMFLYALAVIFCGSLFLGARVVNKRDVRSRRIEIPEEEIVTNVG